MSSFAIGAEYAGGFKCFHSLKYGELMLGKRGVCASVSVCGHVNFSPLLARGNSSLK